MSQQTLQTQEHSQIIYNDVNIRFVTTEQILCTTHIIRLRKDFTRLNETSHDNQMLLNRNV